MNFGYPIRIATKEYQKRKHRKKRINKKWRKRYGCSVVNMMPDGEVMLVDGVFYMTKKTFEEMKQKLK